MGSYPSIVIPTGAKQRVQSPLERQPSTISTAGLRWSPGPMNSFFIPLLMLLVSIMSLIYWDILYLSPPATHMRECFVGSRATKQYDQDYYNNSSLDMAFTWFCISSKAVDTSSDRSGMYTQHFRKSLLELLWVCRMPSYFELLPSSSESVLRSKLEWL